MSPTKSSEKASKKTPPKSLQKSAGPKRSKAVSKKSVKVAPSRRAQSAKAEGEQETLNPAHSLLGRKAPSFTLPSQKAQQVRLEDFKGKWVILYFYPKDLTPGCTQESCEFQESGKGFEKADAVILGASRDSVASHLKFAEKYGLQFHLLADESGTLTESYQVWQEKKMYGRAYMGIVRSTFLIDPSGKVVRVYSPVSVTGHVQEVLQTLQELQAKN